MPIVEITGLGIIDFVIFIAILISPLASFIFGLKLLKRYKVSKEKRDLILGILLTFVVPGVIIYLIYNWLYYYYNVYTRIMCYYIRILPPNATAGLTLQKDFVKKFKNKLPKHIYAKISKD